MIKQSLYLQDISVFSHTPELKRENRESNMEWLKRAYNSFGFDDASQWSFILLMGGKDIVSFRIRVAQSHLRPDMLPSYWSDCALLQIENGEVDNATLSNIPLFQPPAKGYAPKRNGVVDIPLKQLPSQKHLPNLALIAIPIAQNDVIASLATYRDTRPSYDAVENILPWLAFVWGIGSSANPLIQHAGFPSAIMLKQIYSNHSFDLGPGISANLSAPEVLWGAAKRWQGYYEDSKLPRFQYVTDHLYDIDDN